MVLSLKINEIFPVPPKLDRLEIFTGVWDVKGTIGLYGSATNIIGTWSSARVSSGWGLRANLKINFDNLGYYEQDDLIGYDPQTSGFQVFGVTNLGTQYLFNGLWQEEPCIVLERYGSQDGKKFFDRILIKDITDKNFRINENHEVEGKQVLTAELSLARLVK